MTKKIVAIGGGGCGNKKADGTISVYDNQTIDQEIIRLTGKEHPNFLFLSHAAPSNGQESYYKLMRNIYKDLYGCECKHLKGSQLNNEERVNELLAWADIIYEGGGSTVDMLRLWEKTGFGEKLKKAWEDGKVMCGLSAGGNCWFNECTTDVLKVLYGEDQPLIGVKALGFTPGHFTPHGEKEGREESLKEILKTSNEVGFLVSRCAALEIVDDKYKVVKSKDIAFAKRAYWKKDKFYIEDIEPSKELKPLEKILNR